MFTTWTHAGGAEV